MGSRSKHHGLVDMNAMRPKSKMWKRKNKANGKTRKEELLTSLAEARGHKTVKSEAAKTPKAASTAAAPKKAATKATKSEKTAEKEIDKTIEKEPANSQNTGEQSSLGI